MSKFRIELRHKQLVDNSVNVVVICSGAGVGTYIPGNVPSPNWTDYTDNSCAEGFSPKWSAVTDKSQEGDPRDVGNEYGSNYQGAVSGSILITGAAYDFCYNWLYSNPCQVLNAIELRLYDKQCQKYYRIFELKADNIEFVQDANLCQFEINIAEADQAIHNFSKTAIEDNWQDWFNEFGTSTFNHPSFSYVVEQKPKFMMAMNLVLVYLVGAVTAGTAGFSASFIRWYRRTMGVGFYSPSPYIRTIIENVCNKFGYTYNTIFDAGASPYSNTCLFFPAEGGIENFRSYTAPSQLYQWKNRTGLPCDEFFNQLRSVFNAAWYITPNNEFIFQHISYFENQTPLIDFTTNPNFEIKNLTYQSNRKKKPSHARYTYRVDPQDTCSNEVEFRYNSRVDFDGDEDNPMLEGETVRDFKFAPTAFVDDGVAENAWYSAGRLAFTIAVGVVTAAGIYAVILNFITGGIVLGLLFLGIVLTNIVLTGGTTTVLDNQLFNYAIRTSSREINIPRLVVHDLNSPFNNAKVQATATLTNPGPTPNPWYGGGLITYLSRYGGWIFPSPGINFLQNYVLFIEEHYFGNLFDYAHEHDNPILNPQDQQEWAGELEDCCATKDLLGVWEGDFIKIGATIILPYMQGKKLARIDDIEVTDSGKIVIKGETIKLIT